MQTKIQRRPHSLGQWMPCFSCFLICPCQESSGLLVFFFGDSKILCVKIVLRQIVIILPIKDGKKFSFLRKCIFNIKYSSYLQSQIPYSFLVFTKNKIFYLIFVVWNDPNLHYTLFDSRRGYFLTKQILFASLLGRFKRAWISLKWKHQVNELYEGRALDVLDSVRRFLEGNLQAYKYWCEVKWLKFAYNIIVMRHNKYCSFQSCQLKTWGQLSLL